MEDKTNSPEEILDVVDENDQVVSTERRAVLQQDPSRIHREVWILLFDDQNRLLLQQRSFQKATRPGYWAESCAGHVPAGHDPDEVAHQELQEELGFDTKLVFIEKVLDYRPTETRFAYFYLGRYAGQPLQLESAEVEQARVFTQSEYKTLRSEGNRFGELANQFIDRYWAGDFDHHKDEL